MCVETCTLCSLPVWEFVVVSECCSAAAAAAAACPHSRVKEMDNSWGGGKFVVCRVFVLSDVRTSGLYLCIGKEKARGGEGAADSAAGDEVRSFKALIASGKRSHFPNHIHAPIIYFLPLAPALLPLTHSLTHSLTLSLCSAVAASLCICQCLPLFRVHRVLVEESAVNVKPKPIVTSEVRKGVDG